MVLHPVFYWKKWNTNILAGISVVTICCIRIEYWFWHTLYFQLERKKDPHDNVIVWYSSFSPFFLSSFFFIFFLTNRSCCVKFSVVTIYASPPPYISGAATCAELLNYFTVRNEIQRKKGEPRNGTRNRTWWDVGTGDDTTNNTIPFKRTCWVNFSNLVVSRKDAILFLMIRSF